MQTVSTAPPAGRLARGALSALGGTAVWLALVLLWWRGNHAFGLIECLAAFGPLVVVPLALGLLAREESWPGPLARTVRLLQLPAAFLAALSFFVEAGAVAAGLAAPWLLVCGLVALDGLAGLRRTRPRTLAAVSFLVARLYLPVGGAWLVLSRLGATPLGFGEPIALLTAVHFHFAAFVAPVILGAAAAHVGERSRRVRTLLRLAAPGILLGPGTLAAGFVVAATWKVAAALWIAASHTLFGLALLGLLRGLERRAARTLLALAALALLAAMPLAGVYAWGEFTEEYFILIPAMARWHGTANALGFGLCGLLAWTIETQRRKP